MTLPTEEPRSAEGLAPPESDRPWELSASTPIPQPANGSGTSDGAVRQTSAASESEDAVVRPDARSRSICDELSPTWPSAGAPPQSVSSPSPPTQKRSRPLEASECEWEPLSVALASEYMTSKHSASSLLSQTGSVASSATASSSCCWPPESACEPITSVPPTVSRLASALELSSSSTVARLWPSSAASWPATSECSTSPAAWSGVVGSATSLGGVSSCEDGSPGGLDGTDARESCFGAVAPVTGFSCLVTVEVRSPTGSPSATAAP